MALNFIDISSHQGDKSFNIAKVFEENPTLAGAIVKSTQWQDTARDNMYVNPYCDPWVQWLIKHNKPWGFFHYLDGHDPTEEAKRFIKHTKNYFGHGVPAADYEDRIPREYGTVYLRKFVETVYAETGIKPFVYTQLSYIQADVDGFRQLAEDGYPLWLAQYLYNVTLQIGFRETPWQQGSYYPFDHITMHQYAHTGRISGYNDDLDLDLFYGDLEGWSKLAGEKSTQPGTTQETASDADWLQDWIDYLQAEIDEKQAKIDELKARQREVR